MSDPAFVKNKLSGEPSRLGNHDRVLPFTVNALDLRGRVVTLGPAVDTILKRHDYPKPVSRLLAEAITLTALLGSALKFEGRFTLQTKTDGAVPMLVVDFQAPDQIRAYARFDADRLSTLLATTPEPAALLGQGHLAMTIDQGSHMNRYQGVVALDGKDLEAVAHAYFLQSEQIPTRVRLAVGEVTEARPGGGSQTQWRAGGLLAQFLPDDPNRIALKDLPGGDGEADNASHSASNDPAPADDEAWSESCALVETVEDHELFDPDITAERLLFRLFNQHEVRVFDAGRIAEKCRCSRERISALLHQFSAEERDGMVEDGAIVVRCEFCSSEYRFQPDDVEPKR